MGLKIRSTAGRTASNEGLLRCLWTKGPVTLRAGAEPGTSFQTLGWEAGRFRIDGSNAGPQIHPMPQDISPVKFPPLWPVKTCLILLFSLGFSAVWWGFMFGHAFTKGWALKLYALSSENQTLAREFQIYLAGNITALGWVGIVMMILSFITMRNLLHYQQEMEAMVKVP